MPIDYRTTSIQQDEEDRPDPASFLSQIVAGKVNLSQIPGVEGARKMVENAPRENALLTALYGVTRPAAATMGGIAAGLRGENILEGATKGLTGETTEIGSDVLAQQGVPQGPRVRVGPLDVSARDVGGFALDVATDPLTVLTLGTGTVARKAATTAAKQALATGLPAEAAASAGRVASAGAKAARPWGSTTLAIPLTKVEKEILPFDPLSAVGHAIDVATDLVPGSAGAKENLARAIGQIFVKDYDLKRFTSQISKLVGDEGAPAVAAGLTIIGNAPKVYQDEQRHILSEVARRMAPLTEEQRTLLFDSFQAGLRISDTAARSSPLDAALSMSTNSDLLKGMPDAQAARSLAQGEVAWRLRESLRSKAGTPADLSSPFTLQYNGKAFVFQPEELSAVARRLGADEIAPGRFAMPEGVPENLLRTTGDEAVDTALAWVQDTYRPTFEALNKKLGLQSFMDNYFKHVFVSKDEKLQKYLGEIEGAPKPRVGLRPVQQRKVQWYHRTGVEGYSHDPLVAIVAEQLELAEKRIQTEINTFVKQTLEQPWAHKLKPGAETVEGYAEYYPKGRVATFLAETLTGAGRKRLSQLITRGDLRPGETYAEAATRAAPSATTPAGLAAREGSNLTSAFSVLEPGKNYDFAVEAVALDRLVPSQLDDFAENPAYPRELQERMRARPASQAQVEDIFRKFHPDQVLVDSHRLDTGPMIVGPDNVVESGNARTLAIRRVARESPERWAAYQERLREMGSAYGLDPEKMPKDAVLVRKRLSDVDRIEFAAEANMAPTMAMSPYEVALRDARRMPEALPTMLEVGENQSVDQALLAMGNREVVKGFLSALPPNEINTISTASGTLNSLGLQRLKDALLALTYQGNAGRRLAEAFTESIDPGVKNIEAAVYGSLPDMAKAEGLIRAGQRDAALSITEDLAAATNVLSRLRQQGMPVSDYLAQMGMFDKELSATQEVLLAFLAGSSRSPKAIREFLRDYARAVENAADPNQIGMFGEASRATKEEMIDSMVGKAADDALKAEGGSTTPRPVAEGPQVTAGGGLGPAEPAPKAPTPPTSASGPSAPPVINELLGGGPPESVDQYLRQVRALRPPDRYALPIPVADALNRLGDVRENILVFKFFDTLQGMWKGSVTTIWPGFHVRNLLGAVFLNWQAGISDPAVYRDAIRIQRAASKWFGPMGPELGGDAALAIGKDGKLVPIGTADAMPLDEFLREARLRGAVSTGYFGEDIRPTPGAPPPARETGAEKGIALATGGAVVRPLARVAKGVGLIGEAREQALDKLNLAFAGRVAGQTIEDNVRLAHVLGRMRLGDTFEQAIESTRRHQIDYCVDETTECLTQRGWQTVHTLIPTDLLLALDPQTSQIVWSPLKNINAQPFSGELTRLLTGRFDSLTTDGHRWLLDGSGIMGGHWTLRTREVAPYHFRTTTEVAKSATTARRLKLGGGTYQGADEATYSNEFVELVAWFITEGHVIGPKPRARPVTPRKPRALPKVYIAQSAKHNPTYVERLRQLAMHFKEQGATTTEYTRDLGWGPIHTFYFGNGLGTSLWEAAPNKEIRPEFLCKLTREQLGLFHETLMAGDGTVNRKGTRIWAQKAGQRIDGFQMLCAMLGLRTRAFPTSASGCMGITQYRSTVAYASALRVNRESYDGIVWCPTTTTGTWMARRNGITYWTGNSDLSDTERKFRTFVPFYSWARYNIANQLEKLASEPRQAATVSKVANMLQSDEGLTDEEKALMGNYVLERFGLVVGRDEENNPKILNAIGLPIEDLGNLFRRTPARTVDQWIGMTGPLVKMPLELVSNHSFFTGRPIDDESYQNLLRTVYPSVAQVPGVKDFLQITETKVTTKDGSERTYYNADPWKMYLFTNVLGRLYYTAGKATDDRKAWDDRLFNILSGTKITSSDINRSAAAALRGEWGYAQQRVLDERNTILDGSAKKVLAAQGQTRQAQARQEYRTVRTRAMSESAIRLDLLAEQAEARQAEGSDLKAAAMKSLRDPVDIALNTYHTITPENFAGEFGAPDMAAFFDAREEFLAELPENLRGAVKVRQLAYIDKLPPNAAKMEREYQKAMDAYRTYQALPPFATPVGAKELTTMRQLNRDFLAQGDAVGRTRFLTGLPMYQRNLLQRYFSIRNKRSSQRKTFEKRHPELAQWGLVS